MVRISDILGALMRGLTTARIQSDLYSGQASQAYLTDPNLKSYPVPRTEIRQAEVNLKVSVLETVQRNVEPNQIALQTLIADLPAYVTSILAIPVKPTSTSPDTDLKPLSTYFGNKLAAATESIRAQLETYLTTNIVAIWSELSLNPRKYGSGGWKTQTLTVVTSVVAANQITVYVQGVDFSKAVSTAAVAWCEKEMPLAQLAIDLAITAFFDLDIAVKKDDLFSLPAHVMSELKLTFAIENYEWISIKDAQGNVINKLTRV
jgi:hypothetical protein